MSLHELARSPYAIPFEALPEDIADAFMWANDRDDLRDLDVPEDEGFSTFEDWKAIRNG